MIENQLPGCPETYGVAVVSGAVASSGLLSLASGEAKNRKRIIFYFTGTGNISVSNSYLLF